jgi:hypothetical protein
MQSETTSSVSIDSHAALANSSESRRRGIGKTT